MKKVTRPAGFFATLKGAKSWAERVAAIKAKAQKPGKQKPNAKLDIDDANGETMEFPEIGDISEIKEGTVVNATQGEHVFEADGKLYTIVVENEIIKSVVITDKEDGRTEDVMNAETAEFVQAVAEALADAEQFKVDATAQLEALKTELASAKTDFTKLKATLRHSGDGLGGDGTSPTSIKIGGKTIDLDKINLPK